MFNLLITFLLFGGIFCQAQALEVVSPFVLDIDVARDGLTRIEIEGETIQDVFVFPPHVMPHFMLHKKGHLFLSSAGLHDTPASPISITLLTTSGVVQDLRLHLKAKKAGPILLRSEYREEQQHLPLLRPSSSSPLPLLKSWMKTFVSREVPEGFHETEVPLSPTRSLAGLEVTPLHAWTNGTYVMHSFSVQGTPGVLLDAALLRSSGDVALLFAHAYMPEEGETTLYVIHPLSSSLQPVQETFP